MTRARILLADDHSAIRERVVHLLETEFEMLEAVSDGPALLEKVLELRPDVCLIDISMPILSGLEVAMQLRASGSTTKIIFLTIHGDWDFVQAALKTGACGYVVKPYIASDLSTAVREVLSGRQFISPSVCKTEEPRRS